MVRLSDLPEYERDHLLAKNLPPLGPARLDKANKASAPNEGRFNHDCRPA